MSEEINEERDMEPDPMFRIKCLKKQLQWMEGQRYDLETTVASLRAVLKLVLEQGKPHETDRAESVFDQAKRMIEL